MDKVEARARELLAAEYEASGNDGLKWEAKHVRAGNNPAISDDCAIRAIIAALREQAGAVPKGWKLVPVEATEAMIAELLRPYERLGEVFMREKYAAMLAVAPSAPVEQAAGGGARNPLAETHAYLEQRVAKEMEGFRTLTGERHG